MKSRLMRFIFIYFALFFIQLLGSAAEKSIKPENVYRYIYQIHAQEWYAEQADLWKNELHRQPDNPRAWYNYFLASKYKLWQGDEVRYKATMDSILNAMAVQIADSYEYNYLRFYNGDRKESWLEKAYQADPERPDTFYEFILHYERTGVPEKMKSFCKKLYESADIAPKLLDYNYNMINSTEPNAILFTNGDNDTYPGWVLQSVKKFRPDVTILNLHLIFADRNYGRRKLTEINLDIDLKSLSTESMGKFFRELLVSLSRKYPAIPLYVAATVAKSSFADIEDDLYMVGLALKYSKKRFDNLLRIKENLEYRFRLDALEHNWYQENNITRELMNGLNVNYVVLFTKLATYLKDHDQREYAKIWKNRALSLADRAKNQSLIDHINELDL